MKKLHKTLLIFASVMLGLIIVDMAFKIFTNGSGKITIIPYVLSFISVHNDGIAYGWMSGAGIWLIIAACLLTLGALTAWYWFVVRNNEFRKKTFLNVAFAFFIAGAVGNLYDRIAYGHVRDFIRFDFWPSFAIFNFADIFITAGTIMLGIWFVFFSTKKGQQNAT